MTKRERLSDAELDQLCFDNFYGVVADDLALAREVDAARHHVEKVFHALYRAQAKQADSRELLPDFCLLAGEVVRLWQPLARLHAGAQGEPPPALAACRSAWDRLRAIGDRMTEGEAAPARKELVAFARDVPELRRQAYVPGEETTVAEALAGHPGAPAVFAKYELRCVPCAVAPVDTLADAATCHPFRLDEFLADLRGLTREG